MYGGFTSTNFTAWSSRSQYLFVRKRGYVGVFMENSLALNNFLLHKTEEHFRTEGPYGLVGN